jgi:hypothetical protein
MLRQGFQLLTPEWQKLKKLEDWDQLSEREVKWPVDLRFGGGMHFPANGGGKPARALSKSPEEATETWSWMARRFHFDLDVLTAVRSGKMTRQQIKKQVAYQTKDALDAYRKQIAISFYGFEDNVLAKVASIAGAPTYTLKDRYGRTGVGVPVDVLFTPEVDFVALINPADDTERGRDQVVSIDPASDAITLAGVIANDANDDLVVFANSLDTTAGENNLDRGFPGLLAHAFSTSLHGIDGSVHSEWNPGAVIDKNQAALDESDFYVAFQTANRRSPFTVDYTLTTSGVIGASGGPQLAKRRYMDGGDGTVSLGFDKLKTKGIVAQESEFCPEGHFFADSSDSLMKFSPDDAPWSISADGKVGEAGNEFIYYQTDMGVFCDTFFRAGLVRKARRSLVVFHDILEATV